MGDVSGINQKGRVENQGEKLKNNREARKTIDRMKASQWEQLKNDRETRKTIDRMKASQWEQLKNDRIAINVQDIEFSNNLGIFY